MPANPASAVDLEALFSAPIAAVINADFMAARQFAEYIQEYGFSAPEPDAPPTGGDRGFLGDLRMVSFAFDQPADGGQAQARVVRIPALSLVPLPLMQVQSAEFKFSVRVLQGMEDRTPRPLALLADSDGSGLMQPTPYRWQAILVSSPGEVAAETGKSAGSSSSLDANIRVHLNINRADVPAGISRLLALMNENLLISTPSQDS